MLHPVGDGEGIGEDTVPPDICALVHVHHNEKSDEDLGEAEFDEFDKETAELDHIEGFAIVHEATEDFRAISQEVTDCFNGEPCAHEGGAALLVCKLKIIKLECITKE